MSTLDSVVVLLLAESWQDNVGSYAQAIATGLAIGVPLLGLYAAARSWYRRTLGRRRDRYDRLARLGTAAQLSFFTSVLGEPPAMRRAIDAKVTKFVEKDDGRFDLAGMGRGLLRRLGRAGRGGGSGVGGHLLKDVQAIAVPAQFTECLFIDRDYYLQTISDRDETVLAFSVTTRSERFAPTFKSLFELKLGRTRFHDLSLSDPPKRVTADVWPRGFSYSEIYYFGNSGYYLHYVFTASNVTGWAPVGSMELVLAADGAFRWPPDDDSAAGFPRWHEMPELHRFRRETAITTYTVIGNLSLDEYPTRFGPHGDEVRTLP